MMRDGQRRGPTGWWWVGAVVLLSLVVGGCVVHTRETRRSLGGSSSNYVEPTVVANCELGQALAKNGCRDIVLKDDVGQETNLREAFASTRCRTVHDQLKAANRRTREYLREPGHDLRLALARIHSECRLREKHIEACRSAGFFASPGGGVRLERYLEGQDACYELADLYRHRLADGYRSAP